jgi:hypothetical protein
MKTQIFHHAKNITFKKFLENKPKSFKIYLISSFNTSQNIIFQKSSYKKIDLLPRGQNCLSYTILYNESKHNILAYQGKADKWWNIDRMKVYSILY